MSLKQQAKEYFQSLQSQITNSLNELNQQPFQQDFWERPGGGGGDTRIYSDGAYLEKGGVNFSEVFGEFSEEFAKKIPYGDGRKFYATGVSLVLHPQNPWVPTVHANFRFIQKGEACWFGGGADLTPHFPFEEDCKHFHKTFKDALDPFGQELYPEFKKKCDEYFYLPHRKEMRGIGGIFFDYQLVSEDKNPFEMVQSCGNAFLNSYLPIVKKRMSLEYTEKQKEFQEIRRGRYVEFNLLYDRGTLFGLKTNGRVESILMSLPLKVRWVYDHQIPENSEEYKLLSFLQPRDWA